VTPAPDPEVHNLKNSKARTEAEAKTKIQDLYARLNRGDDFSMVAQNYSEDSKSASNGGDMGSFRNRLWRRRIRNCASWSPPFSLAEFRR